MRLCILRSATVSSGVKVLIYVMWCRCSNTLQLQLNVVFSVDKTACFLFLTVNQLINEQNLKFEIPLIFDQWSKTQRCSKSASSQTWEKDSNK